MVDYARIIAPFSGMITKRFADPGAMIQAGTASQSQAMPLVRLAQIDRLRTVIPVPESIVPQMRVGAAVHIRVNSIGKTFTATHLALQQRCSMARARWMPRSTCRIPTANCGRHVCRHRAHPRKARLRRDRPGTGAHQQARQEGGAGSQSARRH